VSGVRKKRSASIDLLNLSLAKAIRIYGIERNLSLRQISERANVTIPPRVTKPHSFSSTTLFCIAHAIGIKASELLAEAERIAVKEHLAIKAGRVALANIQKPKERVIMPKSDDKDAPETETEEEEEAEEEDDEEDDEEDEDAEEDEEDTTADEA